MQSTPIPRADSIGRKWFIVDARGKTLGRLATKVATILRGKHKPTFTPHLDTGDHVVVINAEHIHLTGDKRHQKVYYNHSGYPGGLKSVTADEMLSKKADEVVRRAVWGMIPHNRLGRQVIRKLKVYGGGDHPHEAQKPTPLDV